MSEEIKSKAAELADEEMVNVAGGRKPLIQDSYVCPDCGTVNNYVTDNPNKKPKCKHCNYNPNTGEVDPPSGSSLFALDLL